MIRQKCWPLSGTPVSAVAGLAAGVGLAYGAYIRGARGAIANGIAAVIDGIESWF